MILTKDVSRISRDYIAEIKFIEQIKKNVEFRTKANFCNEPDEDELLPSKSFLVNKKEQIA